ncbi:probable nucleoredoxin 2 [Salvia splendens]|uniref:probable nucleoredoxin 2 n=1 Tax=Salvia splendens TaxID=180675 RepID=UPI001C27E8DF|nr:probable nucleoredoxin 2 [Salvia splendens]
MTSSKLFSLLASKDRDFLLSLPTGTRVIALILVNVLEFLLRHIYFSANWCCNFTPLLANAYKQLKDRGPGFEVVFVSCDEDLPAFD